MKWRKKFEITDEDELIDLFRYFELDPAQDNSRLRSIGSNSFRLFSKGKEKGLIEYLYPDYLRFDGLWTNDAKLKYLGILNWLNSKGVPEPINRFKKDAEEAKKRAASDERFFENCPSAILQELKNPNQSREKTQELLEIEIPDPIERIRRLFKLLGISSTPWSQFSMQELIPMNLLMSIEQKIILEAIELDKMDMEMLEGMSRFFSSWRFQQEREEEFKNLPKRIYDTVIKHYQEHYKDQQ